MPIVTENKTYLRIFNPILSCACLFLQVHVLKYMFNNLLVDIIEINPITCMDAFVLFYAFKFIRFPDYKNIWKMWENMEKQSPEKRFHTLVLTLVLIMAFWGIFAILVYIK